MADRESIKTKVWDENVGLLNSAKKDIDAQAEAERLKQRQEAEASINKVNGMAKEQSDSLYKDYDMAEQISAVQKIINERYIKRKMAEWGLSSSGIKDGKLKRAEQLSLKASNENRQIFNKGKTEINTWKQGQIAKIEKVRDGNIGVIDKNAADLKKQADGDFNKWVDTETNRQYSYAVEQEQKLLRQKNERIKAVSASIAELKGKLGGYLTEWAKWTCIQSHIEKYGVSNALINMLGGSGYGKDDALQKMTSFFNNKKVSDKYKIQRFVDYYKIYGMPSEEYMKAITSGNMPGHNVTMSELKSALASIDETGYAKNRAIATNSEYDPFILSGKKGAELLGQYEGYWRQKDARKKEALLDKNAENVKMKAEDDEKSSYDQVIDELAELLREKKDNKALSFWDKLESRVSTTESSYKPSKNPVSNENSVGLSGKYDAMMSNLSKKDIAAGITVTKIGEKYYYDYTKVVMSRLNEVLHDFYNHDILTYEEYIDKYSLKLFDKFVVSTPGYDEYAAAVLGNLWFFYDEVTHGAPWDIKRDEPWKQQFGDIRMPFYNGIPQENERFVFRGERVTREDLGNITYGYLGSAMGIGDVTLYWGGGVANKGLKNIFSQEVRDASNYYGDSKEDNIAIKKGIDFYYADYPNAKPGINRTLP